jgi:hypothetical protein
MCEYDLYSDLFHYGVVKERLLKEEIFARVNGSLKSTAI